MGVWCAGFIVGLSVGAAVFAWKAGSDAHECRKQHNVYRCEMTWLPAAQQD